jgi:hypothetical protein
VNLGWHLKRADVNAGYAFSAPTGRYTAGASNNLGSGYWGNNITSGTTYYITKNKGLLAEACLIIYLVASPHESHQKPA